MKRIALVLALISAAACKTAEESPKPAERGVAPAPARMRRLLARQYANSVRDLLGASAGALAEAPPDFSSHGFQAVGAGEVMLTDSAVYRYEVSARAIAEEARASGALMAHVPCSPSGAGDVACHRAFVERFGRLAFRRALATEEIDRWTSLAVSAAAESGSFEAGPQWVAAGMLQSPNFLFQVEIGEPDPKNAMRRALTGYEMATRLSYFLLDTTPADALLDLAENGGLDTADEIRAAATDLLERPEAKEALRGWYAERFKLDGVESIQKDPAMFPQFDTALAQAMKTEALLLWDEIVWDRDADYRELFDTPYAWVNADLAQLYGVSPPASGFEKRQLPPEHGRSGILTQGATLAMLSHPALNSPTRRGKFVMERLLCREILPPPPGVDTNLPPDPGEPETMRQKLERHMTDPSCSGCHMQMDPIGFALESFDAIGAWRDNDNGLPIDPTGEFLELGPFTGATGMAALLREAPLAHRCLVRGLYRHGAGHLENFEEAEALQDLDASFEATGFRVKPLLVEMVASESFRHVGRDGGFGEPR